MGNVLSRNGSLGSVLGKRRADHEDRDNVKRMRAEPTETDAGITAFVNPTLPGFRGIIKYRFVTSKEERYGLISLTLYLGSKISLYKKSTLTAMLYG